MNIYQYYRQFGVVHLNNSLAALVPAIIISAFFVFNRIPPFILWVTAPFFALSIYYYQSSLVYFRRANKLKQIRKEVDGLPADITNYNEVLLAFLPAPSLRMLIFEPNGNVVGEIRDLNRSKWKWILPYLFDKFFPPSYGIFNSNHELLAKINPDSDRKEEIQVRDTLDKPIGFCQKMIKRGTSRFQSKIYIHPSKTLDVEGSLWYTDIRIKSGEGEEVAKLQKGWLPRAWSEQFNESNAPLLTFNSHLSNQEKLVIFGYLVFIFQYQNH